MLNQNECIESLHKLSALLDEIEQLEVKLKTTQMVVDELSSAIQTYFETYDIGKLSCAGRTFFIKRTASVNIKDKEVLQEWLAKKGDLESLRRFDTQKFKTYYKELINNNEELPPGTETWTDVKVGYRKE